MGELGPHDAASSNVVNSYRLQGKLLLILGEMDTNVDPRQFLRAQSPGAGSSGPEQAWRGHGIGGR
jgi:hypothetical protein